MFSAIWRNKKSWAQCSRTLLSHRLINSLVWKPCHICIDVPIWAMLCWYFSFQIIVVRVGFVKWVYSICFPFVVSDEGQPSLRTMLCLATITAITKDQVTIVRSKTLRRVRYNLNNYTNASSTNPCYGTEKWTETTSCLHTPIYISKVSAALVVQTWVSRRNLQGWVMSWVPTAWQSNECLRALP